MRSPIITLMLVTSSAGLCADPKVADSARDHFEKRIRPLLVDRCLACHGSKESKGGLRLDTRSAVLRGGDGGAVVVPGKPKESRLLTAVQRSGELKMPPDRPLSSAEVGHVERWIADGAVWPESATLQPPETLRESAVRHWAFQPISHPRVPSVDSDSDSASAVDQFIGDRRSKKGLSANPPADRRALIRRMSFDVTGLPPKPAEIDEFLADRSPQAVERLVDRLLASPAFGERWGRHWLDVARYADNKGYVFFEDKAYPWAWTYREYVINALNRDVPYDRFIREQLAADLLPDSNGKTLSALGFLTVGGHFMGNTHDVIDDRIDVVTRGLLGLTVACARCHDHKFDPVSQGDYYALYGVFRSTTEPLVPPVYWTDKEAPAGESFRAELAKKEQALSDFVHAKHRELVTQARARAGEYLLAAYQARHQPPADDFMLIADKGDLNPAMIARWRLFLEATKKLRHPDWSAWHRYADLNETEFAKLAADVKHPDGENTLVRTAFAKPPQSMKETAGRYGALLAKADAEWKATGKPLSDPALESLRTVLYGPNAPADAPVALDWGFLSLFPDRATQGEYQKLIKDLESHLVKGPPRTMSVRDTERPYDPRVFIRGNPGRLGESVARRFLSVLAPASAPFRDGSGRRELADAIASPTNPLTARVQVNRVWRHYFGRGLVGTPGDFGLRGDPPTHPELLDHLAREFVTDGWSNKQLHRMILLSRTYQQSSNRRADAEPIDPENLLYHRANRRRLDIEPLHDAMAAVGDGLRRQIGGPSVPLFGATGRRAVYGMIDRLEFPALLANFDIPNPAASAEDRTHTTVGPQALFWMNGPYARASARRWIQSIDSAGLKSPVERIDAMFLSAFGRPPANHERDRLAKYVADGPAAERWVDLAHALLMSNEFSFID